MVKPFSFTLDKRVEDRHKYNEKMQKMQKAQQERERLEKERQDREDDEKWKMERKKTIPKVRDQVYRAVFHDTLTPSYVYGLLSLQVHYQVELLNSHFVLSCANVKCANYICNMSCTIMLLLC